MRAKYVVIGVVVGVLLSSAVVVLAGNMDPPTGPADAASQMVTLEQIYDRLDTGAWETRMASFSEPSSGPGTGTMHSLDDIMAVAPAVDDTYGAVPGEVLTGKTFWGLRANGTWGTQTGTAALYSGGLPKTGQTECYKVEAPWGSCTCGTEGCPVDQDGDLEKGIAWPSPRFTVNGDGTVTDNLTGLIWLEDANYLASGSATDVSTWADKLHDGCASCGGINDDQGLDDGSAAGDWRLPNVRELHSLIDYSQADPALPSGHPFTNVHSDHYWTSTTLAGLTSHAWVVDLYFGWVSSVDKTSSHYGWPVRGGQ